MPNVSASKEVSPATVLICDEPEEGSEVREGTLVSGWAYSPAGIREVSLWIGGRQIGRAKLGLKRPDVAQAHPEWDGALRSGYRYRFEETPFSELARSAEFVVVAEDERGRRAEVRRAVRPTEPDRRPVVYAGRFVDQMPDVGLPDGYTVLGEQETPPHKLTTALDRAEALVLLDVPSFPFEAMTDDHRDIPIVAMLPSGFDVESLITRFGSVLFERLGFFDRVVAPDPATWEELRQRYHWAESQRIPVTSEHPSEVAKTVSTFLTTESISPAAPGAEGIDHGPRANKALHCAQVAALQPRFVAARRERDASTMLDVLEVGTGVGRWASSFDPTKTRFVGIDARKDLVDSARANFPEGRFDHLGADLLLPYEDESFDLVFSVAVMHLNPAPARRTLLSEMWRVARPGGQLLFLESFVFTARPEEPNIYPMSVSEFVELILDTTAGRVVLERMESLRYPGEDLHRGGLITLSRLGIPKAQ